MSRRTVSPSASSASTSSRGGSLWSHTSQSTHSNSTAPTSFEASNDKRVVYFKETPRGPKNYRGFESESENGLDSGYAYVSEELTPRHTTKSDISWTTKVAQDVMIHLEFDCSEDIESHLEELSRLKRLGRFNDARRYFESCRTYCGNHPDLIIDYVDTLLAQGALKDVLDFVTSKDPPILAEDCGQTYHHYLHSALCVVKVLTLGWLEDAVIEWRQAKSDMISELKKDFVELSSLQIRFLCHFVYLETTYVKFMGSLHPSPGFDIIWESNWVELYAYLLRRNRVWDMRDIFHQVLNASGVKRAIGLFFGTGVSVDDSIDKFVSEWTQDGDESTELAMLDVLVTVGLQLCPPNGPVDGAAKQTINQCMEYARRIATSIRERCPTSIKSSSYLLWILAEVSLAETLGEKEKSSSNSCPDNSDGFLFFVDRLPIYVPRASETSSCRITPHSKQCNELLSLGLNAARDLGDYDLEVSYLEELVYKSGVPQLYLPDLIGLQKNVIGNKSGYLGACLAKYLWATEQETRRELSNELSEIDRQDTSADRYGDPILKWFQRKIQLALCSSFGGSKELQDLFSWIEKSAFYRMPEEYRDQYQQFHSKLRTDDYYLGGNSITKYNGKYKTSEPCQLTGKPNEYNARNAEPKPETHRSSYPNTLQRPRNKLDQDSSPQRGEIVEFHQSHHPVPKTKSDLQYLLDEPEYPRRDLGSNIASTPYFRRRQFDLTTSTNSRHMSPLPYRNRRWHRSPSPDRYHRLHRSPSPDRYRRLHRSPSPDRYHRLHRSPSPYRYLNTEFQQVILSGLLGSRELYVERSGRRLRSPSPSDKRNEIRSVEPESTSGKSVPLDTAKEVKKDEDPDDRSSKLSEECHNKSQAAHVEKAESSSDSEHSSKAD
ncbi:hypothetical protein SBOR_6054 [Sclerotinia borealis F-4128]|uniref:Uncharacterized protein n=1 Tax=Sclerotinia borealis (strain F-4128) TaxID=1432307 RepID=W9CCI1_SCLBF|nr:hypothetical protein SBOR_6054 [Sclerotinia borealis F-4128]